MKAITLWQPWASLVALGVKTIETRSWSTSYRGPLAIHAARRQPEHAAVGDYTIGRLDAGARRRMWEHTTHSPILDLPLGAVVATCTLVDVVLMRTITDPTGSTGLIVDCPHEGDLPHQQGGLWLIGVNDLTHGRPTRVEDQRPYGDFAPGRYAWLLADIEPLAEPVPARGRQQLWEWTP